MEEERRTMVKMPRSARRLEREMDTVEEHAENAEKLFGHFVDLHLEREKMIQERPGSKDIEKSFKRLRRNIQREGTILKLLERDLEDVDEELEDALEGFKKSSRMVDNDAIKELNFLIELVQAVENKMDFLRKKQKYYHAHKASYEQIRKAIIEKHPDEKEVLKELSDLIAPVRLQKIQHEVNSAKKVLEGCKHNKKKLDSLIAKYRQQISTGRRISAGAGYFGWFLIGACFQDGLGDFDINLAIKISLSLGTLTHFLLASLVGYKKINDFYTKEEDALFD